MSHYSNGYAVAIIQNGKFVETRQDGRVAIPFGTDYVIRLINRNSKRAVAKVSIDGQQVTGDGIIVPAYGDVNLERPTDKAVTFRFASTESKAADVHGEKGLIQVEWRPEKMHLPYLTVEGIYSSQTFRTADFNIDYLVPPTMTMIKLMGYVESEGISRHGTRYCPTCRTKTMKSSDRYCRHCGEQF